MVGELSYIDVWGAQFHRFAVWLISYGFASIVASLKRQKMSLQSKLGTNAVLCA